MWFFLAVLSAFFNSLSNVARRTHGSLAQPAELAWWSLLLSMPLGLGLVLVSGEPLWTSTTYIAPAVIAGLLSSLGSVCMFRAYKYGDASAVSPIANALPVVLVISSFFILGTVPSPIGLLGIVTIVAGVYYSSVSGKHRLSHPMRQVMQNKGARAMLLWAVVTAVATTFVKLALRSASVSYVMLFLQVMQFAIFSLYLLFRPMKHRTQHGEEVLRRWGWHLAAISVFSTLSVFFQYQAMHGVEASYVLAVKRLDVLMTVLLAGLFLREKHILRRFQGAIIAVAGVAILLFAA